MKKIYMVENGCTLCGMCAAACAAKAIRLNPIAAVIDPCLCTGCGNCKNNCASEAINAYEIQEGING